MYSPFRVTEDSIYYGAPAKPKEEDASSTASTENVNPRNKNSLVEPTIVVPIVPSIGNIVTHTTRKNFKLGIIFAVLSFLFWIIGIILIGMGLGITAQIILWMNYKNYKHDIFKSNRIDALRSRKAAIIHSIIIFATTLLQIMLVGIGLIIGFSVAYPSQ